MKSLIRFILRFHFFILFILIESIALSLTIQSNHFQRAKVVGFTQNLSGFYHSKVRSLTEYLNLREVNQKLSAENTRLNNILYQSYRSEDLFFFKQNDTVFHQQYYLTNAGVINNSVNKQHNFLTLNKGSEQGVQPDMAVTCSDGVVGVIFGVSKQFSTVISLLNTNLKISARLKNNTYFGSLGWDGKDYRTAILTDIPYHVKIQKGDTIVTSGYSAIFPEGILLGTIKDYNSEGGNFYIIRVNLSTDFKNLAYVNIISNLRKTEQLKLENSMLHD